MKICAIIKNIKKPFMSNQFMNIEQIIGPLIAPIPNINCSPPPAATNFSLGQNHLYVQDLVKIMGDIKLHKVQLYKK